MKDLILLFTLIVLFACQFNSQEEKTPVTVQLIENDQGGYNIYSDEGTLLLEFTSRNTDSLSLETLKYIIDVGREGIDGYSISEDEENTIKTAGY